MYEYRVTSRERAFLEHLRVPTDEMLAAADPWHGMSPRTTASNANVWARMIGYLLGEDAETSIDKADKIAKLFDDRWGQPDIRAVERR